MSDIRLQRPDYIPLLQSYGISTTLNNLTLYHPNIDRIKIALDEFCIDNNIMMSDFTTPEVEQLISDLHNAGYIDGNIYGGSNVSPITRASPPTATIQSGTQMWVSLENLERPFDVRFYVNNVLKTTAEITIDNSNASVSKSLTSLNAVSGDTIQICLVFDSVISWWTSAAVP